jgi:hypothetical protein
MISSWVCHAPFKSKILGIPISKLTSRMGFNYESEIATLVWNWSYLVEWDEMLKVGFTVH